MKKIAMTFALAGLSACGSVSDRSVLTDAPASEDAAAPQVSVLSLEGASADELYAKLHVQELLVDAVPGPNQVISNKQFRSSNADLTISCSKRLVTSDCSISATVPPMIVDGAGFTAEKLTLKGGSADELYAALGVPEMLVDSVPGPNPVISNKRFTSTDSLFKIECSKRATESDCTIEKRSN